jgi:Zn-dependent protease with chaperone function
MTLTKLIYALPLIVSFGIFSQQDFNNYKTLNSFGKIPADFSSLTYKKIAEELKTDKGNLTKTQEKIFLQGIHYGIDDLLHSGMVIYGDEISEYIRTIAVKILENKSDLIPRLKFYTLKSNESNAFSTDQGIVFVTTGLIAQLTSEAQLAFVLAHEISHFTEKHVVETFEYQTKNSRDISIRGLSVYSKEKEFEADRLGLKLYYEAGYSKEELLPSFDVLMYSYLPFDEVEFPKNYYSDNHIFIPENLFPTKKYEIEAVEDYDDSQSSHPNIKKRKEQIESEIKSYSNWGQNVFVFGKSKFEYIRNLCRFESVRTDILDANYADALYSIFILEKDYPKSLYLKRMKAQAWLGLAQFKKNGSINKTVDKNSDLEGEIATIHFFIKKISKDGLFTLALRQIYDLKKLESNDKQINAIYNYLLKELASASSFKIENFSKKTFEVASKEFLDKKNKITTNTVDSIAPKKSESKYDKIKSKKNVDNPDNFDSTKFYLYGISDLLDDTVFTKRYGNYKEIFLEKEKEREAFESLTYKQQRAIRNKNQKEELHIGVDELIVVEPMVFSYRHGSVDLMKSEKLKHDFSQVIESSALDSDIKVYTIDRDNLELKGTEIFNERSALFSFMQQVSEEDNFNIFPVDYELLEDVKTNYGTSKVLFTWVEHQYTPRISSSIVLLSIFIYPVLPIYVPLGVFLGHDTEMNVLILDIEKGSIDIGTNYYFKDTPRKLHLGAHMFHIFNDLKTKKKA